MMTLRITLNLVLISYPDPASQLPIDYITATRSGDVSSCEKLGLHLHCPRRTHIVTPHVA